MCVIPSCTANRHMASVMSHDFEPSSMPGRMWEWMSIMISKHQSIRTAQNHIRGHVAGRNGKGMNKTARLPLEATPVCRIDGAAPGRLIKVKC